MSTNPYNLDGFYFRSGPKIQIHNVKADDILELRHLVLRPNQPFESTHFEGDKDLDTVHYAAFDDDGNLVACATLLDRPFIIDQSTNISNEFKEAHPELLSTVGMKARQLRGMAVHPNNRGQGVGALLLNYIETHQSALPIVTRNLWCNARESATPFYINHGWIPVSDKFDIPDVGPHYQLFRQIRSY
ncbi:GNAT family N-acetyltransferase [Planctomycetota bacterium]|nr:GNAT family N-acetyltransferase [Planctomycetota bacterium]